MSSALQQYLHEQAPKKQAGKELVAEWREAIERLFAEIKGWLKESDPEGVIDIEEGQQEVNEPGIGRYRVPRLNLGVLGKWIGIIPKARSTNRTAKLSEPSAPSKAEGRVDITDEVVRYLLYRFKEGDKDVWYIEDPHDSPWDSPWVKPEFKRLNKVEFESALMRYLR